MTTPEKLSSFSSWARYASIDVVGDNEDSVGLDRHCDSVDERVRTEHADAIVAIDIHAEDGVAHSFGIPIADLDARGPARLEHDTLGSVRPKHARVRDLDLLRAPSRADLAARGALALLLLADLLVIRVDDVVRRPLGADMPLIEPDPSLAPSRHRPKIVGNEHDRLLRGAELADLGEAFVLEVLVPDREHLVDEEDVRLEVHRDRESEAHVHAARVRLHGSVEEAADVGKLLYRGHGPVHLLPREAEKRAIEIRVFAAAEIGVESGTDLEQRGDPTVHLERPGRRLRSAGEELEEGRFS